MRTLRRAVWLMLPLSVAGSSLASSEEIRAGIVTGLQGSANVTRASLTQPRELKFKDDVYLRDEIVTGDDSIARILLGGKALLTVRERSMVRITESPGVSTVAVTAGRAAVNVLKERMRPGDSVEIVTPNATAAIRGTIVVTEVEQDGADVRSTISVLRGLIDVTQHDATGKAFGRAVAVSALQQVTVSGGFVSSVRSMTRPMAERMADDYRMKARAVPVAPAMVDSEVDRAVRDTSVKDTSGKGNGDKSADKGDKGGDKSASGGNGGGNGSGNGGGTSGGNGGGNGGGDRVAGVGGGSGGGGGNGGGNSGGGSVGGSGGGGGAGGFMGGGGGGGRDPIGGGGDRDRDRDRDKDRGNKGGKKNR